MVTKTSCRTVYLFHGVFPVSFNLSHFPSTKQVHQSKRTAKNETFVSGGSFEKIRLKCLNNGGVLIFFLEFFFGDVSLVTSMLFTILFTWLLNS